jgi:hypothetical protein
MRKFSKKHTLDMRADKRKKPILPVVEKRRWPARGCRARTFFSFGACTDFKLACILLIYPHTRSQLNNLRTKMIPLAFLKSNLAPAGHCLVDLERNKMEEKSDSDRKGRHRPPTRANNTTPTPIVFFSRTNRARRYDQLSFSFSHCHSGWPFTASSIWKRQRCWSCWKRQALACG